MVSDERITLKAGSHQTYFQASVAGDNLPYAPAVATLDAHSLKKTGVKSEEPISDFLGILFGTDAFVCIC